MSAAESQNVPHLQDPGFCIACGYQQDGCEPDMRRGLCEECGKRAVYGASELVIMGYAG